MSFTAMVSSVLLVMTIACLSESTSAEKAIRLLSIDKDTNEFVLNEEALSRMKRLSSPVRVIAAIGDARVGKSTALNYIHHTLAGKSQSQNVEEVFETGETMAAVTRGVWLSIHEDSGTSVVLLDVEGTDLGNDEITTKISMFTALMSSSLMLFMKEAPSNHMLEFLYKICRLGQLVLPDSEDAKLEHFPRLIAVLRGALKQPEGYGTLEEYIKDSLIASNSGENNIVVGKCFPKENINVFELPYISNYHILKDIQKLSNTGYLNRIVILKTKLLQTLEKKTLNGASMEGEALVYLANMVVHAMKTNEDWKSMLPNFYKLFETDNCKKSFDKYIKPLLDERLTATELKHQKQRNIALYEKYCIKEEERRAAKQSVRDALEAARKRDWQFILEIIKYSAVIVGGTAVVGKTWWYWWVLSDIRLKRNITLVSGSEYESIGLHGVQWIWNNQAKRLGLIGRGEGVVAQEVEQLYPWAVIQGYDGYKRVNYNALKAMLKIKSLWK